METIRKKDEYNIVVDSNEITVRTNIYEKDLRYKWDVGRHCNAEYEVHIVLQGRCRVSLNDDLVELSPGTLLIIPPGCYHSSKTISNDFEHFFFSFYTSSDSSSEYFATNIKPYLINKITSNMEMFCLLFQNEWEKKSILDDDYKYNLISLLFIEIMRQSNYSMRGQSEAVAKINPIDIIDQFFEQNHVNGSSEEELARMLSLSKKQTSRYLLKYYGLTFREKLIATRLEHAKRLLENSNIDILSISQIVGYSSEASFYNMFNKQTGESPLQYRKRKRKGN